MQQERRSALSPPGPASGSAPGRPGQGRQPGRATPPRATPRTSPTPERSTAGRATRLGSALRTGRLVAVEAALGAIAGGIAVRGAFGWSSVACGGITLAAALARHRGRWYTDGLGSRARRAAAASVPPAPDPAQAGYGATTFGAVGAAATLAPRLRVAEHTDRNGFPLGVVWDGQGFAAAVELDTTTHLTLDLAALVSHAAADDADLTAMQVLVEQVAVPPLESLGFAPTMTYRQLAATQSPLLRRVWVVLRHEPLFTASTATRPDPAGAAGTHGQANAGAPADPDGTGNLAGVRGGNPQQAGLDEADRARRRLAAALARLRVYLAGHGLSATPLGAAALVEVLRGLSDANPGGELRDDRWLTSAATHRCLRTTVNSAREWNRLLAAAAAGPADRSIVSYSADLDRGAIRTHSVLRLVTANQTASDNAVRSVVSAGLGRVLRGEQAIGVLATLPLGGGARPLRRAVGWSR